MLSLLMRVDGTLFLKTTESEIDLGKGLVFEIGGGDNSVLSALEHELTEMIIRFLTINYDELMAMSTEDENKRIIQNMIRVNVLSNLESIIDNGVLKQLEGLRLKSFKIIDV